MFGVKLPGFKPLFPAHDSCVLIPHIAHVRAQRESTAQDVWWGSLGLAGDGPAGRAGLPAGQAVSAVGAGRPPGGRDGNERTRAAAGSREL